MARCRRNVDNFLEACRRIGVDEVCIYYYFVILPFQVLDNLHKSNQLRTIHDHLVLGR